MGNLPAEMLYEIFSFMPEKDKFRCEKVSGVFRTALYESLEEVDLSSTKVAWGFVNKLLKKTSRLKELKLQKCRNITANQWNQINREYEFLQITKRIFRETRERNIGLCSRKRRKGKARRPCIARLPTHRSKVGMGSYDKA